MAIIEQHKVPIYLVSTVLTVAKLYFVRKIVLYLMSILDPNYVRKKKDRSHSCCEFILKRGFIDNIMYPVPEIFLHDVFYFSASVK